MNSPRDPIPPTPLPFLGVLSVSGPDALGFLQGQLTSDVRLLADGRTQLAALNTPQGRVIALPRLRLVEQTVHALLPTELLEPVHAQLRRFVLRSKVQLRIADELRVAWTGEGLDSEATAPDHRPETRATPAAPERPMIEVARFDYAHGRRVVALAAADSEDTPGRTPIQAAACDEPVGTGSGEQQSWLALDIAAGLPQVFAATSGAFVPQMLNLDLLDAISFSKGCYTGQEIVARTQHLGRIKRRLLGYRLPPGTAPAPLSGLYRDGAKVAEVLMAAARDSDVCLLAVTSLDARGLPLLTEDGRTAEPVELPYQVTGSGSD
jgi:tRNA-modifying protein YgfZ